MYGVTIFACRVSLDDDQRNILVFLREVGAVDNRVYRQFAGCDTLKASAKLSMLRDAGLLEMKGRGKATYYVPGDRFPAAKHETIAPQAKLHHLGLKLPHLRPKLPHLYQKI